MSDNQKSYNDYGQEFKSELENALNSGDFSGLNRLVNDTVNAAVSGVSDQVNKGVAAVQSGIYQGMGSANGPRTVQSGPNMTEQWRLQKEKERAAIKEKAAKLREQRRLIERVFNKGAGGSTGTVLQVLGGIGIGLNALPTLFFLLAIFILPMEAGLIGCLIVFGSLLGIGVGMLVKGTSIKNRLKRAQRYFEMCEQNGYMNISELAATVQRRESEVLNDLEYLIRIGVFPQGHLDAQKKCFLLTDEKYQEYSELTGERARLQAEEEAARNQAVSDDGLTEEQRKVRAVVEEGRSYITQIRAANDAIPGEVFSEKLYQMENILKEIFINLEKKPEQLPKMHKLMNYYLPTTLKLVNAYQEFDQMSIQGKDVTDAKGEIENTIDTINAAFGELLNKLFMDTAMDVTTDAQVLKTMLAKEGLTEGGMEYGSRLG